jgi:aspartyl-tRNA(Asn)/glutamyl-tRNA(Gln) amidotransferase subunit C|tara:strand:+ start:141 stop:431 length:291 start_codon:yes stop_codon:yes gene_type:complete
MPILNNKIIEQVAHLAYLNLSQEEIEALRSDLENILDKFQSLSTVNTEGISPTSHTSDIYAVMREDCQSEALGLNEILDNAPTIDGDFIKIRPVLD